MFILYFYWINSWYTFLLHGVYSPTSVIGFRIIGVILPFSLPKGQLNAQSSLPGSSVWLTGTIITRHLQFLELTLRVPISLVPTWASYGTYTPNTRTKSGDDL